MAVIKGYPKFDVEITLVLDEAEARFLEGMAGFDHQHLLEAIRACIGKFYSEDKAFFGNNGCGLPLADAKLSRLGEHTRSRCRSAQSLRRGS